MSDTPLKPMIFALGCPRSGTTLLRVMLAGHPQLFSPPEMVLAPFDTMAERRAHLTERFWEKGGLRRALIDLEGMSVDEAKAKEKELEAGTVEDVYRYLQARLGERILVDKDPRLCAMPERLRALERLIPDARYVWIVRHPGSVIRSLENMPMAELMLKGYAGTAPDCWLEGNRTIEAFLQEIPQERWARIRYEDLVTDPRATLEPVASALGVPFDEALLHPYEGERMRSGPKGARAVGDPNLASRGAIDPQLATKWLGGFDVERLNQPMRELAADLGYDLSLLPVPPLRHTRNTLQGLLTTAMELEATLEIPTDVDAVEARRFLTRMLSASIDTFVEEADVDHPEFHHSESPTRKMFADCPDTNYLRAPIRLGEGRVYEVAGRVPEGTTYMGVLLYRKGGRIGARLPDRALGIDADGRFSVRIATAPQEGTHLVGEGDETAVMVRQYFTDRKAQEPIEVSVRLVSPAPEPPGPLTAEALTLGYRLARRMLQAIVSRTLEAYRQVSVMAVNRFVEIPGEGLFPTPDNRYRVCWYRIGRDQVMRIRGKLPEARYFSLTLYNALMESLEYRHHPVHLNHSQIQTDEDGRFEVLLANRRHDHPNLLLTTGHRAGYLLARSLLPTGDLPELEVEVLYEREWEAEAAPA